MLPTWNVDLNVYGPITINRVINFRQRKELNYPDRLYSNIEIHKNGRHGVKITATAFSNELIYAKKAALYFVGQAIDTLSFSVNLPIYLSYTENRISAPKAEEVRRIIKDEEWIQSFKDARLYNLTEPTFLRALGWYRKGLCSDDPFDKFLAFWNSIETITSKYNPNKGNCNDRGSKCHMWECFKSVWGEVQDWKVIPNQKSWIDQNYDTRKEIAHGIASIDIEVIEQIIPKIEVINEVAFEFIKDWKEKRLNPNVTPEIGEKLI